MILIGEFGKVEREVRMAAQLPRVTVAAAPPGPWAGIGSDEHAARHEITPPPSHFIYLRAPTTSRRLMNKTKPKYPA